MAATSPKAPRRTRPRPQRRDARPASHTRAVVQAFEQSQKSSMDGPEDKFALALALMRRKHNREAMDVLEDLALHGEGRAEIFEAMAKAGSRCDEHTVAQLAAGHADRLRSVPTLARPNRRIRTLAGESPTDFSLPPQKKEPATSEHLEQSGARRHARGRAFDRITEIARAPLIVTGIFGSVGARAKPGRWGKIVLALGAVIALFALSRVAPRWVEDADAARFLAWTGLAASQDAGPPSALALAMGEGDFTTLEDILSDASDPQEARLAQAMLYRFADGAPPEGNEPEASGGEESADNVLAIAVGRAPVERLTRIESLADRGDDPLALALLAETLQRAGDNNGAQNVYDRLADTGELPPHLAWIVAVNYLETSRPEAAVALRNETKMSAPEHPWTQALSALLSGREVSADSSLAPRVALELFRLKQALASGSPRSSRVATEHLNRLGDIAGPHRLHTIMVFDALMAVGAYNAASSVTAWESWPRGEDIGDALEGTLDASIDRSDLALPKLTVAWRRGIRDPRASRRLSELMLLTKRPVVTANEIQSALDALFPHSEDVALAGAGLDIHQANYASAQTRLSTHLAEIRRYAPPATKALAYGLLARAAIGRENSEEARTYAERSLRYDPSQAVAKHVMMMLDAS